MFLKFVDYTVYYTDQGKIRELRDNNNFARVIFSINSNNTFYLLSAFWTFKFALHKTT